VLVSFDIGHPTTLEDGEICGIWPSNRVRFGEAKGHTVLVCPSPTSAEQLEEGTMTVKLDSDLEFDIVRIGTPIGDTGVVRVGGDSLEKGIDEDIEQEWRKDGSLE